MMLNVFMRAQFLRHLLPCAAIIGRRPSTNIESHSPSKSMRLCFKKLIRGAAVALLLCAFSPHTAGATGAEPATDPQADPAPCLAAAAAGDADNIIAVCGALIGNEKTARADRIKAL